MGEIVNAPKLMGKIVDQQVKKVLSDKMRYDLAEAELATDTCGCNGCLYIERRRAEWWDHPLEVTNGEGTPIANQAERMRRILSPKPPENPA